MSLLVQALPSLHATLFGVEVHPVVGLHPSSVQGLPSEQFGAAPPTQEPLAHLSFVVQALPSLHVAVFGA
jgi:hypothetical protein